MNINFINDMAEVALTIVSRLSKTTDVVSRKGLNSLLLTLCRNMEDIAPRNVSEKAKARADALGIGDLRQYHWDDGSRFPGGRKASRLHWEHWRPAADMKNDMLSLENPTVEDMKCILSSARICWILLEENKILDDLGQRYKRKDPNQAYQQASIKLAHSW